MRRLAFLVMMIAGSAHADVTDRRLDDFVVAQFALAANDLSLASTRFAAALAGDPGSTALRRRAFELALASGDEAAAARLLPAIARDEPRYAQASLLEATRAIRAGRWNAADAAIKRLEGGQLGSVAMPILLAWVSIGRGQGDAALALLKPQLTSEAVGNLRAEHRARAFAATGRIVDAAAAFGAVVAAGADGTALRLAAAAAAVRAGDGKAADALLSVGDFDGTLEEAKRRLAAGQPIAAPDSARTGTAALFARLAGDVGRQGDASAGLVFARLATIAAPEEAAHRLLVAELLARAGQPKAAVAAISDIRADSLWAGEARALEAGLAFADDRPAAALALLERAARAPGAGVGDVVRLGDALRNREQNAAAADAYARAIALAGDAGPRAWTLHFRRGGALEPDGRWPEAEIELRAALALAPDEALVLNYLGYALLDRGLKLDEAERLVRRAVELQPDNAAIVDSLGWLYFRTGRYAEAIAQLERAVASAPGDPEMNDHLGDAYWQVGRQIEARFRWRAAAAAEPAPAVAKRLAAKLDYGLDRASLAATTPGS